MKKLLLILSMFLLVGCSSVTSIKEPAVLYEYNGKKITEEDMFQNLMAVDKGNVIIQGIEEQVIKSLIAEKNYDLTEESEKQFNEFERYAKEVGVTIEQFAVQFGFSDVETFKEYIANNVFMDKFARDMIAEDLDALTEKYGLRNYVVFSAVDENEAQDIALKAKTSTIDELKENFKKAKTEPMVYTNQYPDLDESVLKALKSEKIHLVEDGKIVFVFNESALTDEEKTNAIMNSTNFSSKTFIKTIHDRSFKVHNKNLKNLMKETYSEYLK